jgi:hypothetical protein
MRQVALNRGNTQFRILGAALIIAVLVNNLLFNKISNVLWLCNLSTLLAGVALLIWIPQVALVGATYMILGMVLWIGDLILNHAFYSLNSFIVHFAFAASGLYLFKKIAVSRYLWIGCFGWYLFAQVLSRGLTNGSENINIAFSMWTGWDKVFSSFFSFWLFVTSTGLLFLFFANKLIWKLQQTAENINKIDS